MFRHLRISDKSEQVVVTYGAEFSVDSVLSKLLIFPNHPLRGREAGCMGGCIHLCLQRPCATLLGSTSKGVACLVPPGGVLVTFGHFGCRSIILVSAFTGMFCFILVSGKCP